jgi:mono/diheme cytochrome c family protein
MSSNKPDLDDSINVAEAHGKVVREAAACAREKRILSTGNEPISVWVLATCGIAVLFAGAILGNGGRLFAYNSTFKDGYVRKAPEGAEDSGPAAKDALAAYMARGAKIYSAKCQGCHGPDAKGDGANFPSLAGSAWVTGETQRFAMIILNGLQGPTSTGKSYGAGMTAQGTGLAPEDLAGIMTYVRNNFGNATGDIVTVDMAKAAMEISEGRAKKGLQSDKAELDSDHAKPLPGDPLDPATLVDPITLQPAAAPEA